MSLEPGLKLAHYEIVELIGKGGMGEVYRAKDEKLGRDVAIKILPDAFADDDARLRKRLVPANPRDYRALALNTTPSFCMEE